MSSRIGEWQGSHGKWCTPILTQTHRDTYTHKHACADTDAHTWLLVIASGQISLLPPKGVKKHHLAIETMSLNAGLGFSGYTLNLSCLLQSSNWFKGKTTSYNTAGRCQGLCCAELQIQFQVPLLAYPNFEQWSNTFWHLLSSFSQFSQQLYFCIPTHKFFLVTFLIILWFGILLLSSPCVFGGIFFWFPLRFQDYCLRCLLRPFLWKQLSTQPVLWSHLSHSLESAPVLFPR